MKSLILFLFIIFSLLGCSDKKFDGTEKSLKNLMNNMTLEEQAEFIYNFNMLTFGGIGEQKLVGFTLEDIQYSIDNIHNSNLKYLTKLIKEMEDKNISNSPILIKYGIFGNPKKAYNPHDVTIATKEEIKAMISSNGDIFDYNVKIKEKDRFIEQCKGKNNDAIPVCECIWSKIIITYSNEQMIANVQKPNEAFNNFINQTGKNCINNLQNEQ